MSKQSGKFGRRPVLQLETEVKNKPGYGFGYNPTEAPATGDSDALSGLVSQYGQSDDEDSDESQGQTNAASSKGPMVPMQAFVAASEPDLPSQITVANGNRVNGDSKQPRSILKKKEGPPKSILKPQKKDEPVSKESDQAKKPEVKVEDDVDEKLKDFLAEIDALDHAPVDSERSNNESEDLDGEPMTPPTLEEFEQQEVSGSDEEEEMDEPEPVKPTEPTTPYQHCLDEQTQYYYYWNTDTNTVTWQIPEEYSQYLLQVKEYEIQQNKYEAEKREWEERQKNKPTKVMKKTKKAVPVDTPPPPPPPPPVNKEETPDQISLPSTSTPEPKPPPPPPEHERKKPPAKEKKDNKKDHKKHKKSSKDHGSVVQEACVQPIGPQPAPPPIIGPQMPSQEPIPDSSPAEPVVGVKEGENSSQCKTLVIDVKQEGDTEGGTTETMEEGAEEVDDDDFIHKQLEEPVFTHYEYVNKKLEAPPPPQQQPADCTSSDVLTKEENFDLDMEDIDKELEMALERKKIGSVNKGNKVKSGGAHKRSHSEVESQPVVLHQPKRPKTEPVTLQDSTDVVSVGRLHKDDLRVKIDSLAESSDLSNLLIDKLEFLDVQRRGLSDLQILLIELETRIEDWKRGGLNSDYLLIKLREADSHLQEYEEHAAPPGWLCQWDRKVKKYYYFNSVTGESQWDYPMDYSEPVEHEEKASLEQSEGVEQSPDTVYTETEEATSAKNTYLDFAQLAEAPPPPPGEPPPPGTAPLPQTEAPGVSLLPHGLGYEDPSETEDTSDSYSESSSSSDTDEKHDTSNDEKYDESNDEKQDESKETDEKYDPSKPSENEKSKNETEEPTLDPAILLPVHSKPVHIAAKAVIKRPTPCVSPSPEKVEGEKPEVRRASGDTIHGAVVSGDQEGGVGTGENPTDGDVPHGETGATHKTTAKEKKKKKDKSLSGGGLSMKRKGMSSMVEKWQKVQKDVEKGSKKSKIAIPPVIEEPN